MVFIGFIHMGCLGVLSLGFSCFLKRLFVVGTAVWCPGFPASEIDADELERQRTAGLVVPLLRVLAVLFIKTPRPRFGLGGTSGILVKGLPRELGTSVAHVHDRAVAALDFYRSYAVELCHFGRALKALPLGSKGCQKTRCQRRPR